MATADCGNIFSKVIGGVRTKRTVPAEHSLRVATLEEDPAGTTCTRLAAQKARHPVRQQLRSTSYTYYYY
eukprot:COSAG06_NODE_45872_length_351_cov_0.873016_1_plen_70_part_00